MILEYSNPMISISESQFDKRIMDAKSEAIKEFAERLKEDVRKSWYYNLCEAKDEEKAFKEIDNLVKEMVGEGK